jgi:prephenate dehydrogenase
MGGAFATAFVKRTSHAVSIRGSHAGSSSAAALSRQLGVRVADDKELLAADIVFVATPPAALEDVAAALKGYAGAWLFSERRLYVDWMEERALS